MDEDILQVEPGEISNPETPRYKPEQMHADRMMTEFENIRMKMKQARGKKRALLEEEAEKYRKQMEEHGIPTN